MEYLAAPLGAFLAAQTIKYALLSADHRRAMPMRQLLASGNMPSGHTAMISAIAMVMMVRLGWDDPLFALTIVMLVLTAYDAMNARRSTGEIGTILLDFFARRKSRPVFRVALGHKPIEVIAGACLGITSGLVVLILL
jgi:hypothetical protein